MLFEALVIALLGMIFVALVVVAWHVNKILQNADNIRRSCAMCWEEVDHLVELLKKTNVNLSLIERVALNIREDVDDIAEAVIEDEYEEDEDVCEPDEKVELPPIHLVSKEEFTFGVPGDWNRNWLEYDETKKILRVPDSNYLVRQSEPGEYEYRDITAICGDCLTAFNWEKDFEGEPKVLYVRNEIYKAYFSVTLATKEESNGEGN